MIKATYRIISSVSRYKLLVSFNLYCTLNLKIINDRESQYKINRSRQRPIQECQFMNVSEWNDRFQSNGCCVVETKSLMRRLLFHILLAQTVSCLSSTETHRPSYLSRFSALVRLSSFQQQQHLFEH